VDWSLDITDFIEWSWEIFSFKVDADRLLIEILDEPLSGLGLLFLVILINSTSALRLSFIVVLSPNPVYKFISTTY
jgi:hypothetical protein